MEHVLKRNLIKRQKLSEWLLVTQIYTTYKRQKIQNFR